MFGYFQAREVYHVGDSITSVSQSVHVGRMGLPSPAPLLKSAQPQFRRTLSCPGAQREVF
jgi:hypothetical protein